MTSNPKIVEFWTRFVESRPDESISREPCPVDAFGGSPEMADELGRLIASGRKTATCSALWEYEADGEPVPKVGDRLIVVDGRGDPLCIVETTEIEVRAFDAVDEEFARAEGSKDLAAWRDAHWAFFSKFLPRVGREPAEDMPLVCERFELVHFESGSSSDGP